MASIPARGDTGSYDDDDCAEPLRAMLGEVLVTECPTVSRARGHRELSWQLRRIFGVIMELSAEAR